MSDARLQTEALSVAEYSARLGRAVREVGAALVEGEIQKVHRTPRGLWYFDLTDGEALLTCKMFPRDAALLEQPLRQGDLVQVQVDRPDLFAARGSLSLIVSRVTLAGEGELLRRRAELLARLASEGLCDPGRRRPLPRFPRAVGVIAGVASDGMSDVVRALTDRWPPVTVITCPSLVQGKGAPAQLIDALARLQEHPLVDVIVLARGGGSVQDLACFDDERLCRAVFACAVPVVCAVGHTDNTPVCNHVAWSAFTPSRSAEFVVPSAAELRREIVAARRGLESVSASLGLAGERVKASADGLRRAALLDDGGVALGRLMADARTGLRRRESRAGELLAREGARLAERVHRRLHDARRDAAHHGELVAARDFRRRGWLLAGTADGAPAISVAELAAGAPIDLHLHDGRARARIETITIDPGSRPDDPDD